MAEKVLRSVVVCSPSCVEYDAHAIRSIIHCSDCLHIDASDAESWHRLGEVLAELELFDESAECLHAAQKLHARAPVIPFSVIPRCLM